MGALLALPTLAHAAEVAEPSPATPSTVEPASSTSPVAPVSPPEPRKVEVASPATPTPEANRSSGFRFGSYGRVVVAGDGRGGPGRDADIVVHGSRLDESTYAELEFRRDDAWEKSGGSTRVVASLAVAGPLFHYDGDFSAHIGLRNLYLEERDVGVKGITTWVGSRMLRGDDIYLLDFWPLDNLNTVGGGARFALPSRTTIAAHVGVSQPKNLFFRQTVDRPAPLNQFGVAEVDVLNRQRTTASLRVSHLVRIGEKAGLKAVAYGEAHTLPEGQRQVVPGHFEQLPSDGGYVVGAQFGAFTGERSTHVNLFLRYASGLAAYGDFAAIATTGSTFGVATGQLTQQRTTAGAHEWLVALGGNWEQGPLGVMAGGYLRSFRNASPTLDAEDVDEGILAVRPHLFLGESAGIAVEGAYEAARRGVLASTVALASANGAATGALTAHALRFGVMPFLSPSGRGDYARPHLRLIWAVTVRDDAARALYPVDDVFRLRKTDHFLGLGAEWWFDSTAYGD
jgi:maltoporin